MVSPMHIALEVALSTISVPGFFAALKRLARDRLGKRLAGTRMWQMLEFRKVSPLAYVDQTSIADLRAQIKTCKRCAKQGQCDATLGYVGWRKKSSGFCPNRAAIDRIARTHSR